MIAITKDVSILKNLISEYYEISKNRKLVNENIDSKTRRTIFNLKEHGITVEIEFYQEQENVYSSSFEKNFNENEAAKVLAYHFNGEVYNNEQTKRIFETLIKVVRYEIKLEKRLSEKRKILAEERLNDLEKTYGSIDFKERYQ